MKLRRALLLLTLVAFSSAFRITVPDETSKNSTLKLVQVIFRHGNRTLTELERYPNDPYNNMTYFPFGYGQLTNAGKRQELGIGLYLRQKYGKFLGDYYFPELIEARSTDFDRTKMSLLLVLRGLFPAKGKANWNNGENWQPIPFNYFPQNKDPVLLGVGCPRYQKLYKNINNEQIVINEKNKYNRTFDILNANSGKKIQTFKDAYYFYFGLTTEEHCKYYSLQGCGFQKEANLTLPAWTKEIYPHPLTELAIKDYYIAVNNTELRTIASGYFFDHLLKTTKYTLGNSSSKKKMYLYSAHENSIAQILLCLDIFKPHIPAYGSHIIFEVHNIDGVDKIRIFYQTYEESEPKLMKLKGCDEFCPLDHFQNIVAKYIPKDENLCYQTEDRLLKEA